MMGRLIVIEGLDGSGKATQAELLHKRLLAAGTDALKIAFPDYRSEASALVRLYLSGALGGLEDVNVYAASSFYAADRYASYATAWGQDYRRGRVIVADRYATSNVCHQMPRLPQSEWGGYLDWLYDYEYVKLGLPRPDDIVYLDMPPEISRKLLEKRQSSGDIHERDLEYLKKCRNAALYAAEKLGWKTLPCYEGENALPVGHIAEKIANMLGLD
jgi:dTMP kinase